MEKQKHIPFKWIGDGTGGKIPVRYADTHNELREKSPKYIFEFCHTNGLTRHEIKADTIKEAAKLLSGALGHKIMLKHFIVRVKSL